MTNGTNNKESGKAGKPGETTANLEVGHRPGSSTGAAAGKTADEARLTLTSGGIASLLKSAFAADRSEAEAGEEVQPAAEQPADDTQNAEGAEEQEGAQGAENEAGAEAEGAAEPEGEAGPEAEAEAAEGEPAETAEDAEEGQLEGAPASVQKRIDKLVAQRETAKTEAQTAQAEVERLKAELDAERQRGPERAAPALPGALPDEKSLANNEATFRRFEADAENYLDETATPEEEARIKGYMESNRLDVSGLKRQLREVKRELQQIPQQRQRLTEYRKAETMANQVAAKYCPWLSDKTSPRYQKAQEILRDAPWLSQATPAHQLALAAQVLGAEMIEQMIKGGTGKGAGGGQPKVLPKVKAPPKVPAAGAAAPAAARTNGRVAEEESVRQQFQKAPTRESVTKLLKIGLRAA
jgi:hypothetical protein